jgi:hypothetical protein
VDLSDTITLEGFVLQNGKADRGGGVRGGTVIRTTIQNCSATFGGGSYQTRAYVSTYKANTAEFFGMAAYGGSAFSCRVEGNASATYGGGMGALFGVTVANTSVTGNTALHDNAGVLLSPAQNMVYFGNVAQRGLYEGAPMVSANTLGSEDENSISVADKDIFVNAAAGDYTLNVNTAALWVKDLGDSSLDGHYDELWHDTDIAGRPRMLGASIDLGPYEIADTFTVTQRIYCFSALRIRVLEVICFPYRFFLFLKIHFSADLPINQRENGTQCNRNTGNCLDSIGHDRRINVCLNRPCQE